MSRLKDLLPELKEDNFIEIMGVKIPIRFNMMTLSYIEEASGKPFSELENQLSKFDGDDTEINSEMLEMMSALLYAVVKTGGTETTPNELMNAIPTVNDTITIFEQVVELFDASYFQEEDTDKLKNEDDSKK